MANWNGLILTDKGRALQAKVEAGQTLLTLTKFKLGNGVISGGQTLERLTDLVSPKQIIGINTCVPSENGLCTITGVVVNTGLTTGYELKELGVFATDPDLGEILYAITIDNHPDYLQAEGGATVVSEEFNLNIAISNTSNVTAVINTAGLATIGNINTLISEHNLDENSHQDLRTKIVAKINEHNTNKDAHQNGIKGNAATATKLDTARKINGVSFDGTADITVKAEANGGNADTVDGKHATDFAPSGYGLGGEVALVTSGSANDLINTGFYNTTSDVTDLPTSSCWYYLIVMRHHSLNPLTDSKKYTKQLAYSLEPAKDGTNMYERTRYNGVWTAWKQIATTAFVQSFFEDNFTIIYPNGGTKDSPANVAVNSRYVMDNPFQGYHVMCVAEVYYNSKWGETGYLYSSNTGNGSTGGCGVKATVNNGQIVVQTGTLAINSASSHLGNGFGNETISIVTPMPCRVKVWKVGKIS